MKKVMPVMTYKAAVKALDVLEQCARYFDKEDDQRLVSVVDDAISDLRRAIGSAD